MKTLDEVISAHLGESTVGRAFSLSDASLFEGLARDAGFSEVKVEEARLTVHVQDPQTFIAMMVQSSVLISPELEERTEEERQSLIRGLQSDMIEGAHPFIHDDVLELETVANVLTARR